MKKTIITMFAFLVIFGVAISGAMAQTWTWQYAPVVDAPTGITELIANPTATPDELYVLSAGSLALVQQGVSGTETLTLTPSDPLTDLTDITFGYLGAIYAVTDDAVVSCIPTCAPIDTQPYVPTTSGTFKHIAAGKNGKLFVLYDDGNQYILTGNPPITEGLTAKLNPQSLNLGSKGNWVTCLIEIPGYDINGIDQTSVAITNFRIDDTDYSVYIPVAVNAPYDFETNKLMVKFVRYNKTTPDDPESMVGALSAILEPGPSKGKIEVVATVQATHEEGTFSGEATFKVIVPKAKKQK